MEHGTAISTEQKRGNRLGGLFDRRGGVGLRVSAATGGWRAASSSSGGKRLAAAAATAGGGGSALTQPLPKLLSPLLLRPVPGSWLVVVGGIVP